MNERAIRIFNACNFVYLKCKERDKDKFIDLVQAYGPYDTTPEEIKNVLEKPLKELLEL